MLKEIALPIALIIIMTGMGMTLTAADFKHVVKYPLATILGLANQLIFLPLVAFGLCIAFGLQGELAVGLILIASCPGGATSNLISHLSKGDTALSVSLTALSSMITTLTIPVYVGLAIGYYMDTETSISLPFLKTVIQLMIVSVIPIMLGMFLRNKFPAGTRKLEKPVNIFSMVFLAVIVLFAVLQEENLAEQFRLAGPAAVSLNGLTMALGFGIAIIAKLNLRQRITLSIESGIQNGTLALGIALGILQNVHIAMPAVVYSLIMFLTGGAMIITFGRRQSDSP